ncbi:aminotransferase V [Yersinia pestis]|uniref:aminotransferase V n=1 Tax=Yersinia pestis TaxID=632 RepID=UPI00005F69E3|nr:aminotransferase V [Yersinia pestis]ABX85719.1 purine catabolism protein PucG [Yersinia pestis Angola]
MHRSLQHGSALLAGIQGMGLSVFGDRKHRMNNVLGVVIPKGIPGEQVRQLLLNDFGIEIGTSFGPLNGKIWRIGTMGYNARKDCVMQTLVALEAVLNRLGFTTVQGAGLQATWDVYQVDSAHQVDSTHQADSAQRNSDHAQLNGAN